MFNDVSKRGNGKEAAAGKSLSAHSSRRLLYMSTYESEIRVWRQRGLNNVSTVPQLHVCDCRVYQCVSPGA